MKMKEKNKTKKLPYNVLRKGVVAGILGLALGLGAFGLTGCSLNGEDGLNGKDGSQWYSGTTNIELVTTGNNGDFYYDTDDYKLYQKENGSWVLKVENFGKPGTDGTNGQDGQNGTNGTNGQDGSNVFIGYDGYIWQDGLKTEFKIEKDATLTENVVEDTIGAYTTMQYFAGNYVDLTTNRIALMANYKPNAKLTQYSGTKVAEIQVVAESAGNLHIGTAKVADIVTARINGSTYTASTTSHDIVAGVNTITFSTPLEVGEDETIVMGGSNSTAKVYVTNNIPVNDEAGNFTLLNGSSNASVISKTGNHADTLAVRVKVEGTLQETQLQSAFPNLLTEYPESGISDLSVASEGSYKYTDSSSFSGKTIKRIGVPVKSLKNSNTPTLVVYKIKTSLNNNFSSGTKITLTFPANTAVNTWAYADCDIELAEDETIAFDAMTESNINWGFAMASGYGFMNEKGQSFTNMSLTFDIQVSEMNGATFDWNKHLEELTKKEEDVIKNAKLSELKQVLQGKNFSILGDSISTYTGYSNDSSNTNSTIGSNAVEYNGSKHGVTSADQTWWKQTADLTGMNVLVNNSSAGDKVTAGGQSRCKQLHDNTGSNTGTNPDIIAVYLGVNDFDDNSISLETFTTAYNNMIRSITETYTDAEVYVFTLVPNKFHSGSYDDARMRTFNNAISTVASTYGCTVVDLYTNSGITGENCSSYMGDTNGWALHPNQAGMDKMTDCFWNALYENYVTNAD